MIYDCFNFYNELELLDIRLHELDNIIDKFVLVESTVTFTNKKKPLFYKENKILFKKFNKKIIHIIVDDSPNVIGNPWIIEHFQFDAIMRGLTKCSSKDTVLVSCVDEIPKKERILEWQNKNGKHKVFLQQLSYYYLNYFVTNQEFWEGTRMFSYEDLLSYKSPYIARFSPIDVRIPDGGWHFSYIGDVERIRAKIFGFSHQEYNNPKYNTPERIRIAIREGNDIFQRGLKFKIAGYKFLPEYVVNNINKFSSNLIPQEQNNIKIDNWNIIFLNLVDETRLFLRFLSNKLKNFIP